MICYMIFLVYMHVSYDISWYIFFANNIYVFFTIVCPLIYFIFTIYRPKYIYRSIYSTYTPIYIHTTIHLSQFKGYLRYLIISYKLFDSKPVGLK